ncbi:C42S2-like protein [Mya arenaria]|uniref:C42S2-like protein n=1 Tax=Mya arenaria TaxID=6604 RepID=A0ABY7G7S0_MYAAR|nr:C42S2-like protein [Mya arenaria]
MAMGMICFNCCITEQPQPRRRRIDRSMIGEPTDFRHTAHVGSSDITSRGSSNSLTSLQRHMSSKENYKRRYHQQCPSCLFKEMIMCSFNLRRLILLFMFGTFDLHLTFLLNHKMIAERLFPTNF